ARADLHPWPALDRAARVPDGLGRVPVCIDHDPDPRLEHAARGDQRLHRATRAGLRAARHRRGHRGAAAGDHRLCLPALHRGGACLRWGQGLTRPMAGPPGALAEAGPDGPDTMGREIAEGPDAVAATLVDVEAFRTRITELLADTRRIILIGTGASL